MLISEQMEKINNFSNNELIIIRFIKSLGIEIKSYSARKIAKETYTSPSTVVRLSKKFNFNSFIEFKNEYLKELEYLQNNKMNINHSIPFTKNNSFYEISSNLATLTKEVAYDTVKTVNIDELNKSITYLKKAHNIYVFSSGTTINLAKMFQEQMLKINYNVIIYDNLDLQLIKSLNTLESDCFILLSYTGETTRILELARNLKRNNAKIIAVTSIGNNHLSQYASAVLSLSSHENITHNIANFSTIVSINLILNIIYSCLFSLDYENNDYVKTNIDRHREIQRQKDVQKNIK